MIHNDLLAMGGLGTDSKKKAGNGKDLDIGGSLMEGGIEGLGKSLLPMLMRLIPGLLVAGVVVAAIAGVVGMIKNKDQYDKDTGAKFDTAGKDFIDKNFKGATDKVYDDKDYDKGRKKAAEINAKLKAEGQSFAMKAKFDAKTGKIVMDTSSGVKGFTRDSANQLDPNASFADKQKSLAGTYSKDWVPSNKPEDEAKNQYQALTQKTAHEVAKTELGMYAKNKDYKDVVFADRIQIKSSGKKDKDGQPIYTLTDPKTDESIDSVLTKGQKASLAEKFVKDAYTDGILSDLGTDGSKLADSMKLSGNKNAIDFYKKAYDAKGAISGNEGIFDALVGALNFKDAPMFHHGGIAPHETPAILRKDETVLDPWQSKVYQKEQDEKLQSSVAPPRQSDRVMDSIESMHEANSTTLNQEDVVKKLDELISVLEGKEFNPKINVDAKTGQGSTKPPEVNYQSLRTS
jgi:hypothetical protein